MCIFYVSIKRGCQKREKFVLERFRSSNFPLFLSGLMNECECHAVAVRQPFLVKSNIQDTLAQRFATRRPLQGLTHGLLANFCGSGSELSHGQPCCPAFRCLIEDTNNDPVFATLHYPVKLCFSRFHMSVWNWQVVSF